MGAVDCRCLRSWPRTPAFWGGKSVEFPWSVADATNPPNSPKTSAAAKAEAFKEFATIVEKFGEWNPAATCHVQMKIPSIFLPTAPGTTSDLPFCYRGGASIALSILCNIELNGDVR